MGGADSAETGGAGTGGAGLAEETKDVGEVEAVGNLGENGGES